MSGLFPDEWILDAKQRAAAAKKAERENRPKGQKCSNCRHHQGHPFSAKYHYCKLRKSGDTSNGFAKTQASGWCAKWEERP